MDKINNRKLKKIGRKIEIKKRKMKIIIRKKKSIEENRRNRK